MTDYVLDTHACVFALAAPHKLGTRARRALRSVEGGSGKAWIPAAVAAEVVLLHELGRIEMGLPALQAAMEQAAGLRFLPLDLPQIQEFAAHGAIRDPFDRLVLSAARAARAKLITRDRGLGRSGLIQTVW